jgi:hypothetical protein
VLTHYLWDLVAGAGVVLLAIGLWCIYAPACLIVLGSGGIAAGLLGARWTAR